MFFDEKMNYPKNCAPFSIYPFDEQTRTDIMMGKIVIRSRLNFSQLLRMMRKAGWDIVDSLTFKTEQAINALKGKDVDSVPILTVRRGSVTMEVPPSLLGRIQFELLSPVTLLQELEDIYQRGQQKDLVYALTNYIYEETLWS